MQSQGTVQRWEVRACVASESRADEPAAAATPAATVWLAPALSAGLLYLAFFPVACGWLAWVALVPLLCLVRTAGRPRFLYLPVWLAGVGLYAGVLQWMRVADPRMYFAWVGTALYASISVPIALALVRRLDRRTGLPLVLTLPAVWVTLEYIRYGALGGFVSLLSGSHQHDWPGGFAWYLLGHTQHDFLRLAQLADLTGVYGITALICAVNAVLFEALYHRPGFRRVLGLREPAPGRPLLLVQWMTVAALVLGCLGYGVWRLGQETMTPGPAIALLQSNVDQRIRNTSFDVNDPEERAKARAKMAAAIDQLALHAAKHRPELMIWPETSYPGTWAELRPGQPSPRSRELAGEIADALQTQQLLGMNAGVVGLDGKTRGYNSAIHLDRDGQWLGRYDKVHRVPFGEYVPLLSVLPVLKALAPYDYDYAVEPGEEFTRFTLKSAGRAYSFGAVICYEDTDPAIARAYLGADGKPPVDFLVNISNDGWFDGTSEHDQHLALARFRAIECRRSLVRAVNMGISAIIDANGRVLVPKATAQEGFVHWQVGDAVDELPVSRWHECKKVAGVMLGKVPIDTRASLYAAWGDWFAWACSGVLLLALLSTVRRRESPISAQTTL
jgi:apolipoprotein N-acyltransferase